MRKRSPIARKVPGALSASIRTQSESIRSASRLLDELGHEVDATVGKNLDVMQIDAAWGLLHRMYERATGHASACLALLEQQRFAAAEALCRTLVESSVNLYYCSVGDSIGTILAY